MRPLSEFFNRIRALFRSRSVSREVDAELEQHLEFMIEDFVKQGMSPAEARQAAMRKMGNLEIHKEDARDSWGNRALLDFLRNFRFGLRLCSRFPESSVLAIIVLALGIGVSAIVFTMSSKLVELNAGGRINDRQIYVRWVDKDGRYRWPTSQEYKAFAQASQTTERLYAIQETGFSFYPRGRVAEERQVAGVRASGNFFGLAAKRPILGRAFLESDVAGDESPIVISDFLWAEFYERDPSAVGSVAMVNDQPRRIIGVMPNGFNFPVNHQIWMPTDWRRFDAAPAERTPRILVCGVLAEGISEAQAQAEFETLGAALADNLPGEEKSESRLVVGPFRDLFVSMGLVVIMSLGLIGAILVLLICSSNVFHIIMARTARRAHELATRCSLGAPRGHVVAQVLVDGMTLALLGAALGLGIAKLGLDLITANLVVFDLPGALTFQLSPRVFWYALGAAVFTGGLAAILPALRASRLDAYAVLKDDSHSSASIHASRFSRRLLTFQVGGSALLLWVGIVALGELSVVKQLKMTFDPETVVTAELRLSDDPGLRSPEAAAQFCEALEDRLRAVAGIQGAAVTSAEYGVMPTGARIEFPGRDPAVNQQGGQIESVTSGLLDVFGLEPVSGRMLNRGDTSESPAVCVVNQDFVRKYFSEGDAEPVGAQFKLQQGRNRPPLELTVVGVIPDIKPELPEPIARTVKNPFARVYVPFAQRPEDRPTVLIGAANAADPQYSRALRSAVRDLSPLVRIKGRILTVSDRMGLMDSVGGMIQAAVQVFGAVVFLTAIIGLYSVVSFATNERRREIGVRVALGATGWDVILDVVRPWSKIIALGMGLGVLAICALMLGIHSLGSGSETSAGAGFEFWRFGLSLTIVFAAVGAACAIAMAVPVRRAASVCPMDVMRSE